ncbi:UNVERIFIED_CONTAM: hypothetical protein Slati_3452300 [Sesamum latifolium]|uniref:Secreted protein n=1 Tax=Sesamum latifolium TaxID=2727402 RepID=A0AAW2UGY6_9LAMI
MPCLSPAPISRRSQAVFTRWVVALYVLLQVSSLDQLLYLIFQMEAIFCGMNAVFVKQTVSVRFHHLGIFPYVERLLDYPPLFSYGKDHDAGRV